MPVVWRLFVPNTASTRRNYCKVTFFRTQQAVFAACFYEYFLLQEFKKWQYL